MGVYKNQIEEMVYEQKKLLAKYTAERNNCDQGNLSCCFNHGKETFYRTTVEDGRYIRTSIDKNTGKHQGSGQKRVLI